MATGVTKTGARAKKRGKEAAQEPVRMPDVPFVDDLSEEWLAWYRALMQAWSGPSVAAIPLRVALPAETLAHEPDPDSSDVE